MSFGLITYFNNYKATSGGTNPSIKQSVSNSLNSSNSSFSLTPSTIPTNGNWLVLVCATNTGQATVSGGGAAWTTLAGSTGANAIYYKKASSEPSSYTITFNGSANQDGATASLAEIQNANTANPDGTGTASSTAVFPTASSSNAGDLAIIVFQNSNSSIVGTAPSGYTISTSKVQAKANTTTAIAYLGSCGSGTISPGSWSQAGGLLATITFKP